MGRNFRNCDPEKAAAWLELIGRGTSKWEAAQAAGVTLTSIRRTFPEIYDEGSAICETRDAARIDELMWKQAERPEPSPAILTAVARAKHPDYAEKKHLEISGPDRGALAVEGKVEFGIAELFQLARDSGADDLLGAATEAGLGSPRRSLPPAPEVLPDPEEPEPPTDFLPAA